MQRKGLSVSPLSGLQVALDLSTRQRADAGLALAQVVRRFKTARKQKVKLHSYAADTAACRSLVAA